MSYTIETPVRCRYCGFESASMDGAVDHAEREHNIVTNAVLDSVETVREASATGETAGVGDDD